MVAVKNFPESLEFAVVSNPPANVAALRVFVRTQESLGRSVRASGRRWSFNDALLTASGRNLSFQHNQVLGFAAGAAASGAVLLGCLLPPPAVFPALVHVQAGIYIRELCNQLDGRNAFLGSSVTSPDPLPGRRWAIPNLGGAAGQTLAGVLSTSTSGSNFHFGPIASRVRALRLVGPGGRDHWIEPSQRRITKRSKLAAALGATVSLHYDDELFYAALTAVGAFGVLAEVVIEVVPQYGLKQNTSWTTWSEIRSFLTKPLPDLAPPFTPVPSGPLWPPKPLQEDPLFDSFEIFLNPYRHSDDYSDGSESSAQDRDCYFVTRFRNSRSSTKTGPRDQAA